MKVILMKVFEGSTKKLDNCRWFKRWRGYEFTIDCVKEFCLASATPDTYGMRVTCAVELQGEQMQKMPRIEFSNLVQWTSNDIKYRFSHNFNMPTELKSKRYKKNSFTLIMSYPDGHKLELGKYSFTQDDLASKAMGGNSGTFEAIFQPTQYLESARVLISIKTAVDRTRKRIEDQRERCRKDFNAVIFTINQFNDDERRKALAIPPLSVNDRFGDTTLFHAAVYLNDVAFVEKCISMGGNPNNEFKNIQSPRKLAIVLSESKPITNEDGEKQCEESRRQEEWQKKEAEKSKRILELLSFKQDEDNEILNYSLACSELNDEKKNENYTDKIGLNSGSCETSIQNIGYRKREHSTERLVVTKKAKSMVLQEMELPIEGLEKILGGKQLCHFFHLPKGCNCRHSCIDAHVLNVNLCQLMLSSQHKIISKENNLKTIKGFNTARETFFTAMYHDSDANIFIPASGGKTLGQNGSGIYWYENEGEAQKAMKVIAIAWENPRLQIESGVFQPLTSSQPSKEPVPKQNSEIRRRKNTPLCSHESYKPSCKIEEENSAFDDLTEANLSSNFGFMVNGNLKKDDWMIKTSQGLINASFNKMLATNIGLKKFSSSHHGGASNQNGDWFHMDLKKAKASAFIEFLRYCKTIGFALSFRERIDGGKLPYAR